MAPRLRFWMPWSGQTPIQARRFVNAPRTCPLGQRTRRCLTTTTRPLTSQTLNQKRPSPNRNPWFRLKSSTVRFGAVALHTNAISWAARWATESAIPLLALRTARFPKPRAQVQFLSGASLISAD